MALLRTVTILSLVCCLQVIGMDKVKADADRVVLPKTGVDVPRVHWDRVVCKLQSLLRKPAIGFISPDQVRAAYQLYTMATVPGSKPSDRSRDLLEDAGLLTDGVLNKDNAVIIESILTLSDNGAFVER